MSSIYSNLVSAIHFKNSIKSLSFFFRAGISHDVKIFIGTQGPGSFFELHLAQTSISTVSDGSSTLGKSTASVTIQSSFNEASSCLNFSHTSCLSSGKSSGSVTATALPVANSADWIVVLYNYIAIDYKRVMPPPKSGEGAITQAYPT